MGFGVSCYPEYWGDTQCWAIFEIPKVMVRTRTIEKHVEIKWRVYIPKKGWEVQEFWALKYYGSDRPVVISDDSFWQNMHNHSVRNNSFMNSGTSQRSWLEGTAKLESVPSLRQIAVENHAMCSTDSVSPIFYTHLWFRSLWGGLRRCKSFVSTKSSDILFSTGGCLSKMPKAPIKIPLIFQKKLLTFRRRRPPRNVKSKKGLSPCKVKKAAVMRSHQVFTKCLSMDRLHRLHLTSFCQDEMDQIPKEQGLVSAKFWQFRGTKVSRNPTVAPGSVDFLQLSGQIHWELHIPAGSQEKSPDYWIHITDYHNKDLI